MANSPASPLRLLSSAPAVRRQLTLSAGLSLLGLGATVAAFILIARAVAGALLGGSLPNVQTLAVIAALLLIRALGRAGREWTGQTLAAQSVRHWRERLTQQALALGPVALASRRGQVGAAQTWPPWTPNSARA